MNLRRTAGKLADALGLEPYGLLDRLYLPRDRQRIRWTDNLRLLPGARWRTGGHYAYAERAHVTGAFQALIATHIRTHESPTILDLGCGTGLVGVASEPFLGRDGHYIGLDLKADEIAFCRTIFPAPRFRFVHLPAGHRIYSPQEQAAQLAWPIEDATVDLVTACGVWSNIAETDALFCLREVARVLEPGGRAIITLFLLDDTYFAQYAGDGGAAQKDWRFDQPAYGSDAWFHPAWTRVPEQAIGITWPGVERMAAQARLQLLTHHPGTWRPGPGILFQDVLVLEKPLSRDASTSRPAAPIGH